MKLTRWTAFLAALIVSSAVAFPIPFLGGSRGGSAVTDPSLVWEFDASTLSLAPSIGTGTPTITRAGDTATRINASGLLEVVSANLPRFDYDPVTLALKGLLVEEARTNVLLHNRDMTNAAWVKGATMTAAKDQVGVDGAANGASSLAGGAVSATNTVLQTVVLASSARQPSVWVKRLLGTGTIEMTTDGGTSWVDITSSITTAYARVSIPSQTLANPITGFRITTSGDAIAVDFVQNENGAFVTSAIPTTTAAVARAADVITLATSAIAGFSATTLTLYAEAHGAPAGSRALFSLHDTTNNERYTLDNAGTSSASRLVVLDGGVAQASPSSAIPSAGVAFKLAGASAANDFAASMNGGAPGTDASGTLPTVTTLQIGAISSGSNWCATIRKLRVYNVRKPNEKLRAITSSALDAANDPLYELRMVA